MSLDRPKIIPFTREFAIELDVDFPQPYFLHAAQRLVEEMGPDFENDLPLFKHSPLNDDSKSLTVSYLYPGEYTHYARRYVVEMLNKWLIPGKSADIAGGLSLSFHFVQNPSKRFFIIQDILAIRDREENLAIQKNLPDLLAQLKTRLPHECFRQAESQFHPLFMPRNEEDTIRNLIVLSNQIKYVRDLPQVSIHYEKQTDTDLTFTVIIARLLKARAEPLRKLLEKSSLKMDVEDVRIMGYLKQKYLKEAAVLRVTVNKAPFFRPDHSVDLLRARRKIVGGLAETLGKFRDFNGGIILRQDESLKILRQEIGKLSHEKEFLLENYFYSLKPAIMQTIYETALLKKHFELLNTALQLQSEPYKWVAEFVDKFLLVFVVAKSNSCKEKVLQAIAPLDISTRNLTMSFQQVGELFAMGFILRAESPEADAFKAAIEAALLEWGQLFFCFV